MIPIKTRYKTYNIEFLAIFKSFKTCWHNLKGYKYKLLVFIDYNIFY